MESKIINGIRTFRCAMLLLCLSCTGLISLGTVFFNDIVVGVSFQSSPLLGCTHMFKKSIESLNQSYTHKIVIVSSSRYWYNKYGAERTVSCGDDTRVRASYSHGDICTTHDADIIVFNGRVENHEWVHLQQLRHPNQTWVHTTEESPFVTRENIPAKELDGHVKMNLTQSYHPNADISVPYGEYLPNKNVTNLTRSSIFDTKNSKLIAWVSSHCITVMWRRLDFVHDLAKLIPVDMYGTCGNLQCDRSDQTCEENLRQYKFILALENSCCDGYITEKFWNTLAIFKAIPVVVGARKEDYLKFAPPNSFIHADDFDSLEGLVEYILLVSRRKDLYDSYFAWQDTGSVIRHRIPEMVSIAESGMCSLISYLESERFKENQQPFEPYGPHWMGGCFECGHSQWLKNYFGYKATTLGKWNSL